MAQKATNLPASGKHIRTATTVKWYRRISVKLALGLGLAMFSIQFLASRLIIESYRANLEELEQPTRAASAPFANYLLSNLTVDEFGRSVPTDEAREVIENFLGPGEAYVWLDSRDTILIASDLASKYVDVGQDWPLCGSTQDCNVFIGENRTSVTTSATQIARSGRHIGTFVLAWFSEATPLGEQRVSTDLFYRFIASGVIATLASLLLVSIVTRRLSTLAADASAPLNQQVETIDLPGPFDVTGDDEIARLAVALNTMRGRIEDLVIQLKERDRQRREWIAQVSHDLRTPLTALSVCLNRAKETLARSENSSEKDSVTNAINVALQDGHRLQTLVDDLFELARLDASEELNLEPVPPGELVRQTVRGLAPMADSLGIELTTTIEPSLPTIRADGRRLMRALENMLRNAVQYGEKRVEIVVSAVGKYLKFEVKDDGPGLAEENGQVVFTETVKRPRRPDSTGLGLIVTNRVATAHGGSLGGENRPEGGASVWILIPIVSPH